MKARLVGPQCFVLTTLPQRSLVVFFISPRLRVFMFLNATRRDRYCPAFVSKGKKWIHAIHLDKGSELTIAAGTEVCSLHFQVGRPLIV